MSRAKAVKIATDMLRYGKGFSETANHIQKIYGNEKDVMPRAVEQYRAIFRSK